MDGYFFVTAASGVESLLREELESLSISDPRKGKGGVSFRGGLAQAYRVCLWSRIASRVLLKLDTFPCRSPENLYRGIRQTDWSQHLGVESTFAVSFLGSVPAIRNSHFAALKVKDAIVDQFREQSGQRPTISIEEPGLRVHVHLSAEGAVLYLDLSGDSLHKRGYRTRGGEAPLKENLAAAVLMRAGWPEICMRGGGFLDPMCGSGTLPIEAAMMAGGIAPGLRRRYFGFLGWKGHNPGIWSALIEEATTRKREGCSKIPPIRGYDIDPRAVKIASENILSAGLEEFIRIERHSIDEIPVSQPSQNRGLIAVNLPYGERLDVKDGLKHLYSHFGEVLKSHFSGWRAAILISNAELGFRIGIRSRRPYTLYNGPIECKLLICNVDPERFFIPKNSESFLEKNLSVTDSPLDRAKSLAVADRPRARMFANRLCKNLRNLEKWANREGISCYRVYDADMPEYALAIDLYRGSSRWVHVQEYQAPRSIDPESAAERLIEALSFIPEVLGVVWEHVYFKVRRRQKGNRQYTRLDAPSTFVEIEEGGHRFQVNFESYLDTGLFLDHRLTRGLIQQYARGRRFLNLFGYTGSATVYAAAGGAVSTTTVDLSKTYLDWARRNLVLNGLESAAHRFIQADVAAWIREASLKTRSDDRFDLIFLDPPTFSNSKAMHGVFDIQRDHAGLLECAAQLLVPDGLLLFSTNYRKFQLEKNCLAGFNIVDISRRTLPRDFERNPAIHRCWEIRRA